MMVIVNDYDDDNIIELLSNDDFSIKFLKNVLVKYFDTIEHCLVDNPNSCTIPIPFSKRVICDLCDYILFQNINISHYSEILDVIKLADFLGIKQLYMYRFHEYCLTYFLLDYSFYRYYFNSRVSIIDIVDKHEDVLNFYRDKFKYIKDDKLYYSSSELSRLIHTLAIDIDNYDIIYKMIALKVAISADIEMDPSAFNTSSSFQIDFDYKIYKNSIKIEWYKQMLK